MARFETIVYLKLLMIICTSLSSLVDTLTIANHVTPKTKFTRPTMDSGSLVASTKPTKDNSGIAVYSLISRSTGTTCILLKTDANVEIKFKMHNLDEKANCYIPEDALVTGDCENDDRNEMTLQWSGYSLTMNFAKTPGGERWYISNIKLTASTEVPQLHSIHARGKTIKLYHSQMLIPTPVGKSFLCKEVAIPLETDREDHPPAGVRGTLLLEALQIQPFMYKSENFSTPFECKSQTTFRDETAPIAVGSTLALAALLTVTGYGIFRYFKVKNVQYNTME